MHTISHGKMVRMDVPDWYAEPEFQAWFNERLGRGLATWQHANAPLKAKHLQSQTCIELAERLAEYVIGADVLFEPVYIDSREEYDAEVDRLGDAREALDVVYASLVDAGNGSGLTATQCQALSERLANHVINADVLFEPSKSAEQEEHDRLSLAIDTLDSIHTALVNEAIGGDEYAYADCFVGVDPGFVKGEDGKLYAEGTDSDMPEKYWDKIVEAAYHAHHRFGSNSKCHIIVWLSPVD
jgi:hypothetical protein